MNLLAASTCCVNNAGSFGDGGTISDRALGVYTAVFWASVVLGVIVTALLLYAFVKFRRRSDADVLFFLDGDTILIDHGYISACVQELFRNAGVASVSGTVMPLTSRRRLEHWDSSAALRAVCE